MSEFDEFDWQPAEAPMTVTPWRGMHTFGAPVRFVITHSTVPLCPPHGTNPLGA